MRLLNVELLICDRCGKRFEMRKGDDNHHGYGTLTVRSIGSRPVSKGDLSPQERNVMQGLTKGKPNKLIARELDITEATVKVHVKAILRKMGLNNRTQAAAFEIANGNGKHDPVEEVITSHVERSADLCPDCLGSLEGWLGNGKPTLADLRNGHMIEAET